MIIHYGCDCDHCAAHDKNFQQPAIATLIDTFSKLMGFTGDYATGTPGAEAPVAYLIVRNGQLMRVCTKCDLSSDMFIDRLFDKDTDFSIFATYDDIGTNVMKILLDDDEWRQRQVNGGRT